MVSPPPIEAGAGGTALASASFADGHADETETDGISDKVVCPRRSCACGCCACGCGRCATPLAQQAAAVIAGDGNTPPDPTVCCVAAGYLDDRFGDCRPLGEVVGVFGIDALCECTAPACMAPACTAPACMAPACMAPACGVAPCRRRRSCAAMNSPSSMKPLALLSTCQHRTCVVWRKGWSGVLGYDGTGNM